MKKRIVCVVMALCCLVSYGAFAKDTEGLVKEKCSVCHELGRVQAAYGVKDKAAWSGTVDRMLAKKGAPSVSHEEHGLIVDWLAAQKVK